MGSSASKLCFSPSPLGPVCNNIHVGSATHCGMKGKGMDEACGLAFRFCSHSADAFIRSDLQRVRPSTLVDAIVSRCRAAMI